MTDADGNIAQHIEYIPYGEVFVEERNSQFSTNFLFNAKELDNETGLYYYGARYLDPTGAMWLSVDPVFHAGTSPYAYCLGNPVKMVDPDGRDEIYYREDGSEISRIRRNEDVKYVLRTQQTTDQMYRECSPKERGNSDPISAMNAFYGEMMISEICRGNETYDIEDVRQHYFIEAYNQGQFDAAMNFIGDDGTGGRSDNNNREYSFDLDRNEVRQGNKYVQNGYKAIRTFIGPVRDASKNERIETEHRNNHTHPSGVGSEGHKWQQAPSATDIENSNMIIRRVFGMRSKTIYLFNREGVKATIPFSVYGR
ncbi:MAG: RHS repeat-associated core domain-containing protein [Paludibacteraceae bacterium]|nr:RHS repeat-associated core domain-containing protein [Paludibacteraceae bacterium]